MRLRRLRTWAKWVCTAAAVTCVGAAVFSRFYFIRRVWASADGTSTRLFVMSGGLVRVGALDGVPDHLKQIQAEGTVYRSDRWYWGTRESISSMGSGLHGAAGIFWERESFGWQAGMSLLYAILLTAAPAALLWYADRRRFHVHQCAKCGYDRRGLPADAKCPECGTMPVT